MPRRSWKSFPTRWIDSRLASSDWTAQVRAIRALLHDQQHGARVLDGVAEAEPGGRRDAARGFGRRVAEIHRHHAEAAALHDQVGDFEGALGIGRRSGSRAGG